jgi:hypothetical protein
MMLPLGERRIVWQFPGVLGPNWLEVREGWLAGANCLEGSESYLDYFCQLQVNLAVSR